MEEDEFRAWDKNTQEMIYDGICLCANGKSFQMYDGDWSENGCNGTSHIIMRYIGVKDKNNTRIYKHDVITVNIGKYNEEDEFFIYIVKFIDGCYVAYNNNDDIHEPVSKYIDYDIEVIDNLYDYIKKLEQGEK